MKQPIKMTPGDELHLTALMAPFSLNLVTGQDRQHLLGYGRSAFEAGLKTAAAAEQAAWHAGLDEGRAQAAPAAVAVPDELNMDAVLSMADVHAVESLADGVRHFDRGGLYALAKDIARAALAATPAAAPDMVSVKQMDANNYCRILAALGMEEEGDPVAEVQNLLSAAAAPVVLPEPAATIYTMEALVPGGSVKHHAEVHKALPAGTKLFAEPEVRALLAGVSAPAAQAVELFGYVNTHTGQFFKDVEPCRKTNEGHWRTVFTAPQTQADARDAESDYQRGYRHGYNRRDAEVQGALL